MSRLATALAAFVIALAACGGPAPSASPSPAATLNPTATPGASASATPPATPAPSGDTAALFREIEDQVVAERGLEARQRPEPTILSEAEVRTRLEAKYREDNPVDEIAVAEETLKALGLLSAGASLGDLYVDMLGSQVAAYYDTEANELFVVSRSGRIGAAEKVFFAHEFTHALQDQHFDVQGIGDSAKGQGDRALARLALVEGDATLLMTRWMVDNLSPAELQEVLVVDAETQAQFDALPAILGDTLMFPYQQGLVLAMGAWMKGGWAAVDAMYKRLPDSTEQVLHPAKYEAGEKPVEVPLDATALAKAMGAGWKETPEDTLGEFQLSVWLRENGVKAPAAGDAAAGWGGDRYVYLRGPDGAYALVLLSAWDAQADADEFLAAAKTAVANLPGAAEARVVPTLGVDRLADHVAVFAASDASTLARISQMGLADAFAN